MSIVYNPESETMAQIEWLELEARQILHTMERAGNAEDRRVLNRQLLELNEEILNLQFRLS